MLLVWCGYVEFRWVKFRYSVFCFVILTVLCWDLLLLKVVMLRVVKLSVLYKLSLCWVLQSVFGLSFVFLLCWVSPSRVSLYWVLYWVPLCIFVMVSAIILRVVILSVMEMLVFFGSLATMPTTKVFDNLATLTRTFKEASVWWFVGFALTKKHTHRMLPSRRYKKLSGCCKRFVLSMVTRLPVFTNIRMTQKWVMTLSIMKLNTKLPSLAQWHLAE